MNIYACFPQTHFLLLQNAKLFIIKIFKLTNLLSLEV